MTYQEFLETKIKRIQESGFECENLSPMLFDFQAVRMNRKAIGFELKESYFNQAVSNCQKAVEMKKQLTLI